MTTPHHDPARGPVFSEGGASRRARERAQHGAHASGPDWRRGSHHEGSDEERWGSGSAWELDDDVLASELDDEIDPLPITPLLPLERGRPRTP